MDCLNCNNENVQEPLICSQCQNSGCFRCWEYFDYTCQVCGQCQERDSIAAISESAHSQKLRRLFNKKAKDLKEPRLVHPLPWNVQVRRGEVLLCSGPIPIATFNSVEAADWACRAANSQLLLMGVALSVYKKIRKGDVWFDGGKEDCSLWSDARKLIT